MRDGVVATVIGGIILAVVLALWDDALRFVWGGVTSILSFLGQSIALPLWLILVIGGVLVIRAVQWARSVGSPRVNNGEVPEQQEDSLQLNEQHWHVLRELVRADGSPIPLDSLSSRTGIAQLRLSAVLEELAEHGLVASKSNYLWGPQAVLTRGGRDYLMKVGAL